MRKFLMQVFCFLLLAIIFFVGGNIVYYKAVPQPRMVAFEVYDAIDISGQQTDYRFLVLGDSVGRQFFDPDYQQENEQVCYLATNQAITAAGNSILLKRFIENNPQLEEVYYVLRPDSLKSNANFIYTYSYFITPLYSSSLKQYLEADTQEQIESVYGKLMVNNNFMKWLLAKYPKLLEVYNNTCQTNFNLRRQWQKEAVSIELSLPYLAQMQRTCEERKIELHLIAPPIPDNYDYDFAALQSEMNALGLEHFYEEFTRGIQYVDSTEFVDGVHLKNEYVTEHRAAFVDRVFCKESS